MDYYWMDTFNGPRIKIKNPDHSGSTYLGQDYLYYEWTGSMDGGKYELAETSGEDGLGYYGGTHISFFTDMTNTLSLSSEDPSAAPPDPLHSTPIGEQEDFGMESFTYGAYQGKTPDQMADYIFAVKYDNTIPPDQETLYPTEDSFKASIKQKLRDYAPQLGQPGTEDVGFLAEQYGGAVQDDPSTLDIDESRDVSFAESFTGRKAGQQREQDVYGLQQEAGKIGQTMQGVYGGGMGTGVRTGITGGEALSKGFEITEDKYGLSKDIAEFDYRQKYYDLEQKQEKKWGTEFQQFLTILPDAA